MGLELMNPDLVLQGNHAKHRCGAPRAGWESYVPTVDARTCMLGSSREVLWNIPPWPGGMFR